MKIYKNQNDFLLYLNQYDKGSWVNLTNPSVEEMKHISEICNIPIEFFEDSLDLEERTRIQYDENSDSTLIIIDFAILDETNKQYQSFITVPVGIILNENNVFTISKYDFSFIEKKLINLPFDPKLFLLEALYYIVFNYNTKLKIINRQRAELERKIRDDLSNSELINLMEVEKSLVYFLTSLKANNSLFFKIKRVNYLSLNEKDLEALEEVEIENNQGIETATLYTNILDSITNSYSSLISNKLNNTMKLLTLLTVFLTIPTLVFSFFGMNVHLPISSTHNLSWIYILSTASAIILLTTFGLWKANMFKK